jgi:hypothetical protein
MQREKLASGAEQAAEKVKSSEKNCEIHPSAAKAGVNPIDLSARVNSCPFKAVLGTSFSAACEALTNFNSLMYGLNRLRKKSKVPRRIVKYIPQRLKPASIQSTYRHE